MKREVVAVLAAVLCWLAILSPVRAQSPPGTAVFTDTVTIPTYPVHTSAQFNPVYGIPYQKLEYFDNYTVPQTYTRITLENEFLRVSLLPELGGRVYEMVFKPTGNNELYRNPVIKPSPWGPPEQSGWLGAGGIEWGLPVPEHGYEWGVPWTATVVSGTDGSLTVTLRDSAPDAPRLRAAVSVTLPPNRAQIFLTHQLENGLGRDVDFSYWQNAMLAPGAPNAPTENLRFIIPTDRMQVHSRGCAPAGVNLPDAGGVFPWSVVDGVDMARLGNWCGWLGFFAYPQSQTDFAGVYDPVLDEGAFHNFDAAVWRGTKGFAFGWSNPIDWHNWTDDGSGYVELHTGSQPTFWDTTPLAAGASLMLRDSWMPVTGLGDITADTAFDVTSEAVLALTPTDTGFDVAVFSPMVRENVRVVLRDRFSKQTLAAQTFNRVEPAIPGRWSVAIDRGTLYGGVSVMVYAADDSVLAAIHPIDNFNPLTPHIWLPLILK